MTATECFDTLLPAALAAHPEQAARLNTVLRFTATGEGDWTITLASPTSSCRPYSTEDEAAIQAAMVLAASDFPTWSSAPSVGVQMWLDKRFVVTGPRGPDAVKLRQAFKLFTA